jgi:hypothetical protein
MMPAHQFQGWRTACAIDSLDLDDRLRRSGAHLGKGRQGAPALACRGLPAGGGDQVRDSPGAKRRRGGGPGPAALAQRDSDHPIAAIGSSRATTLSNRVAEVDRADQPDPISRLRRPIRASGGPARRRHASNDALLLVPPLPSSRPPDRRPIGRLPRAVARPAGTVHQ